MKNEGLPPPSCLLCKEQATQLRFQRKCCLRSSCVTLCRNLHLFKVLFWIFSTFSESYVFQAGFKITMLPTVALSIYCLKVLLPKCWDYTVCIIIAKLFLFLLVLVYTKPCYVAKTGLNSWEAPCLSLSNAGITAVINHTQAYCLLTVYLVGNLILWIGSKPECISLKV